MDELRRSFLRSPRLMVPAAVLLVLIGLAVFGPLVVPYSPTAPDLFHTFAAPSRAHLLGTDQAGRDVLSRTIAAARLSLLLPVCVVLISSTVGSIIGAVSAARGGWLDAVSHRGMTVLMALPGMLLGIVIVARFGAGIVAPVFAVALGTIPHIALLVRSAAAELLSRQFMTSYRLVGFGPSWIVLRRGIRHLMPVIGTQSLMNVGSSLLWLAGLSFLGLGVQPPDADWGLLIHDGRQAALRGQWWQALAPAVCLATFVLATHALAEGLSRKPATRTTYAAAAGSQSAEAGAHTPTTGALLTLHNYRLDVAGNTLITGGELTVEPGEIVCLVGPSGAGKSLTLRSLIGLLPESARAHGATLSGFGRLPDHDDGDGARLRDLRRHHLGLVVQESRAGINPMRRVGAHLTEVVRDDGMPRRKALARATSLLADVGLPPGTLRAFPGQLSGGMAARVAIAGALMPRPRLLLADEPTAALDVVTAQQVATALTAACRDHGSGLLMTTHDEALAHAIADRIYRVGDGALTPDTAGPPAGEADAIPPPGPTSPPVACLRGVGKKYGQAAALDDVSLVVDRSIGLLGRSGSGKSTLARILVGLESPTTGSIVRADDGPAAQLVWQDPDLALDPLQRIGPDLAALVTLHSGRRAAPGDRDDPPAAARDLLAAVGLPPRTYSALPGELSGGMRQRVVLARALAVRPRLLVLDEPTAQLDLATSRGVQDVILSLQLDYGMTLVVISHDVSVLAGLAGRLVVLDRGRVVETGDTAAVLGSPSHPRTRELIEAAGRLSPARTAAAPRRYAQDDVKPG